MKNTTFILACVIAVGGVFFSVRYNQEASVSQQELHRERYTRMTTEENLEKAKTKLSSLQSEVARLETKNQLLEAQWEETSVINSDLKLRLDQAANRQTTLEEQIQTLQTAAKN